MALARVLGDPAEHIRLIPAVGAAVDRTPAVLRQMLDVDSGTPCHPTSPRGAERAQTAVGRRPQPSRGPPPASMASQRRVRVRGLHSLRVLARHARTATSRPGWLVSGAARHGLLIVPGADEGTGRRALPWRRLVPPAAGSRGLIHTGCDRPAHATRRRRHSSTPQDVSQAAGACLRGSAWRRLESLGVEKSAGREAGNIPRLSLGFVALPAKAGTRFSRRRRHGAPPTRASDARSPQPRIPCHYRATSRPLLCSKPARPVARLVSPNRAAAAALRLPASRAPTRARAPPHRRPADENRRLSSHLPPASSSEWATYENPAVAVDALLAAFPLPMTSA